VISKDLLMDELERARQELDRLESIAAELPFILEERYKYQLSAILLRNRELIEERSELSQKRDMHKSFSASGYSLLPFFFTKIFCCAGIRFAVFLSLAIILIASILNASGVAEGFISKIRGLSFRESAVSKSILPSQDRQKFYLEAGSSPESLVSLRADQLCWVEVRNLFGKIVFTDTIGPDESRVVSLGSGLEIAVGKPEIMYFRIDRRPWRKWSDMVAGRTIKILSSQKPLQQR
jgi:hypothetical protein